MKFLGFKIDNAEVISKKILSPLQESFKDKTLKAFLLVGVIFFFFFYVLFPSSISKLVDKPNTFLDWFPMPIKGGDFIATYVASKSLLGGYNIYLNNASFGKQYLDQFAGGPDSRYSYTPLQAYLLAPLSFLPFEKSYSVWSWVSAFLILASIFLFSRMTKYSKTAFIFLTLFYSLSSFFWFQIERGQTDSLLLFFISLSLYLYFKKKHLAWAALFFSLAILLKVFLAVLVLFFILRKEFKFLAYTVFFSLVIILVTGFNIWWYWLFTVIPKYANYYLGFEVDHSLAYFFSGFLDKPFPQIIKIAEIFSALLAFLYLTISYLSKNKSRNLLLLELAIISIIAEISTPWSANYKLVTLLPLFIAPFLILEIESIKNRVLLTLPLLASFVLLSPIYNEFYGRFLFSFVATLLPGQFVAHLPIYKLAEFRVSFALLFCIFYLLALQFYLFLKETTFFYRTSDFVKANKVKLAVIISGLFLVFGSAFFWWQYSNYQKLKASYRKLISSYSRELPLNDAVSVVGWDLEKKSIGTYSIEVILKVRARIDRHLAAYIHAINYDTSVVEGINFFPYVLVNFWPVDKYVVVHRTVNLTAGPQYIYFGLWDLSDGAPYGEKWVGYYDLRELK